MMETNQTKLKATIGEKEAVISQKDRQLQQMGESHQALNSISQKLHATAQTKLQQLLRLEKNTTRNLLEQHGLQEAMLKGNKDQLQKIAKHRDDLLAVVEELKKEHAADVGRLEISFNKEIERRRKQSAASKEARRERDKMLLDSAELANAHSQLKSMSETQALEINTLQAKIDDQLRTIEELKLDKGRLESSVNLGRASMEILKLRHAEEVGKMGAQAEEQESLIGDLKSRVQAQGQVILDMTLEKALEKNAFARPSGEIKVPHQDPNFAGIPKVIPEERKPVLDTDGDRSVTSYSFPFGGHLTKRKRKSSTIFPPGFKVPKVDDSGC